MNPADFPAAIQAWLPFICSMAVALGLSHLIADLLRAQWARLKKAVRDDGVTNIFDTLVGVVDPLVLQALDLVDKGDQTGAKKVVDELKAKLPKPPK